MALTDRQTRRKEWLEKMLDAIEARISGDLESGGSSMSINGRSLQRYTMDELNGMYSQYNNELTRLERQAAGKPKYSAVRVRF